MSRSRKWWHKCNHDRVLRDQLAWNLPDEALGLLKRIECMVGSTDPGHETGILHTESGEKMPVSKLTQIFSRGDEVAEAQLVRRLDQLARAEQICPRALERGQIKLIHWKADQEMPSNADGSRKRSEAEDKEAAGAITFREHLEKLFACLGKSAVTESDVLSLIKAARGGYPKTQKRFLQFLLSEGVLTRDREGHVALAALASPAPAGIGFSGSGDASTGAVGAGMENFPNGKFPIEIDPEPEKRMGYHSQLDSAGAEWGAGEASAGRRAALQGRPHCKRPETRSASGSPPDASAGRDSEFAVHGSGPSPRGSGQHPAEFGLVEPGDAYRCSDPLRASIDFLSQCPGWAQTRFGARPCSAAVLRGRWRDLRKDPDLGPEVAEQIWRTCLDQAITDRIERQGWKSWVAIFMKRVHRKTEFFKPMPPAVEGNGCGRSRTETENSPRAIGLRLEAK